MKTLFGTMPGGREIYAYTIADGDVSATVLEYGATLQKLVHKGTDVICGFDTLEPYCVPGGTQGATVGRYANRISGGKITLDGVDYPIVRNNGTAHLHGGKVGFHHRIWSIEESTCKCGCPKLICKYTSADMEEGYPGKLYVTVTFKIRDNALVIDYRAETDKPTYVNLTNHSYFNLHGCGNPSILDHKLTIYADKTTAVNPETLLPNGERPDVTGTAFDFRTEKEIGRDIANTGLAYPGYDHNFILSGEKKATLGKHELTVAAICRVPEREMTVLTTKPDMQVYTGNFLGGGAAFKGGAAQQKHMAVCFETQYEPDSPTRGEARLNPGELYHHITAYQFQ